MIDARSLQAQLVAIRAQVDALLVQLAAPQEGTEGCPHPLNQRRDLQTMGGPERWLCRLCGHEHEGGDS